MVKNLVYLASFTFVVILSWIGFGIYHSYTTSTISSDASILISPIPAHFDLDVVKGISNRKIVPADLSTQAPSSSEAAKISPTPTQTNSVIRPLLSTQDASASPILDSQIPVNSVTPTL